MRTKENLIAAKALIDTPEKWVKGKFDIGGCFCALGALGAVLGKDPSDYLDGEVELGEQVPEGFYIPSYMSVGTKVVKYNDDPSTTHADIMALFDRAIANAD